MYISLERKNRFEREKGEHLSHCQKNRIIVKKNEKGKGEEEEEEKSPGMRSFISFSR